MADRTKIVWVPNKQKIKLTLIDNPLSKTKAQLVNRKVTGVLLNEKKYREVVAFLKANEITYDLDSMGHFDKIAIKDFLIPEEVQRLLDVPHCINILNKFDPRLLSPIYVVRIKGSKEYLVFDSMHTLETIAALAKAGLWSFTNPATGKREIIDANNWENFKVPTFIIETDEESFASLAALYRNGEGSKKWGHYDYHRIEVRSYELYGNAGPNDRFKFASTKQHKLVKENIILLPENHTDLGKIGTCGHVKEFRSYDPKDLAEFNFVVETNNKYWNGNNDSQMFGFYENLYKGFVSVGQPTSGKAFDDFLDEIHGVIKTFFTSMAELRSITAGAYKDWLKIQNKDNKTPPFNCALAIVLKLYKKLGGKHNVPSDVNLFVYSPAPNVSYDIYDSLPLSIRHDINNYTL
jgi:hypothetical protein